MAHLSQPFDLATNRVVKKMEQCELSDYFVDCITEALMSGPKRDVTTIKVDLKFSTLTPIHAKTVAKVYKHLKSDKDKQVIWILSSRYNRRCKEKTGESKIWT